MSIRKSMRGRVRRLLGTGIVGIVKEIIVIVVTKMINLVTTMIMKESY
mgnify:CR=1 FL=1